MTMAPRGRPRKPGRSDVATEHMRMMGFNPDDISRELKALLEIYGEDGWLFIESDAYKVLIDALLDAQEKGSQPKDSHENEDTLEVEMVDKNVVAVSETADAGPSQPHFLPSSSNFLKAIAQDSEADIHAEGGGSGDGPLSSNNLSSSFPTALPHIRRKPCYGWICDDDEGEDEILVLNQAVSNHSTFGDSTTEVELQSRRKTRWDVAPDLM